MKKVTRTGVEPGIELPLMVPLRFKRQFLALHFTWYDAASTRSSRDTRRKRCASANGLPPSSLTSPIPLLTIQITDTMYTANSWSCSERSSRSSSRDTESIYSRSSSTSSESSLGSRSASPADGLKIPSHLRNVIRTTSDCGVEMKFPLSRTPDLQRQGMGIGKAEALLVRFTPGSKLLTQGFCVHLSNEENSDDEAHTPWEILRHSQAPDKPYCHGVPSLVTYQLSRMLWRHLFKGFVSLESTYLGLGACITQLPYLCVVCGRRHSAHLRRPTTCSNPKCVALFSEASQEIHVGDIWLDPLVVDLLLTAAHAAAVSTHLGSKKHRAPLNLLKGCPVSDPGSAATLLERFPDMRTIARGLEENIGVLESLPDSFFGKMFLWACTAYGGFLTEPGYRYHIPGFHGIPQFLLANAHPCLEERYAAQVEAAHGKTTVMFHGTSWDRLSSILCKGLCIGTDTPLMVHEVTSGRGVYVTTEPAVAAGFATPMHGLPNLKHIKHSEDMRTRSALSGRKFSSFRNQGVLLACEVAWPDYATRRWADREDRENIWCIKEPANIIVRYVFLVKRNTHMPRGKDIRPCFAKAFARLRSGN